MIESILIAAVLTALPQVEAISLEGESLTGELVSLSKEELVLKRGDASEKVPMNTLLEIRFAGGERAGDVGNGGVQVSLVDGSVLLASGVATKGKELTVVNSAGNEISLPQSAVSWVRFASDEGGLETAWSGYLERKSENDLLIIRKGEVLDRVEGVIVGVSQENVKILLDENELPIPLERVYGLIYSRKEGRAGRSGYEVSTRNGDRLLSANLTVENEQLRVTLSAGGSVLIPLGEVAAIDLSSGKLKYLSDLKPTVEYTPYFDLIEEIRLDKNYDNQPLSLGGRTFKRGVCIHSRTLLRYPLGGEYQRFLATAGIDDSRARDGWGDVLLKISVDGKELFNSTVRNGEGPRTLNLDVSEGRELEVYVDFGKNLDIGDHLTLGDARVSK